MLGSIVAVVAGSVVYRLVVAAALFIGLRPTDMRLATSVIVVAALAIPHFRGVLGGRAILSGSARA